MPHLATEHVLRRFSEAQRHWHGGGTPLLTQLTLACSYSPSTCTFSTLAILGQLFPELEILDIDTLSDSEFYNETESPITAALAHGITVSVAPLPRLRQLTIRQLCGFKHHMGSLECDAALSSTFAACPILEFFSIG